MFRENGVRRVYPPKVQLFDQRDHASAVLVLHAGLVKMLRWDGSRAVLIGVRSPGWLLGAGSAVAGLPQTATAETLTRIVVYALPAARFIELMLHDIVLWQSVHCMHIREMCDQVIRFGGLGSLSAEARLRRLLVELWNSQRGDSDGGVRRIPYTQADLAELAFTTREHVNRLFRKFEAAHLIRRGNGWIVSLDAQRLAL